MIIDRSRIARWQIDALRSIAATSEFIIYSCTNSPTPKRSLKHAFYYALNLWAIRNRHSALLPLPDDLPVLRTVEFESVNEGAWQRLPPELLDRIATDGTALLVKFGMGLLRVPPTHELPVPILSYHHGDPRSYRGRPAGFYELFEGRDHVGQVVQLLSNQLDAGEVIAFAESRAHHHSYRATMVELYARSPLLLSRAIANALAQRTMAMAKGPNYRLPSNLTVARFCAQRLNRLARRLLYGAFVEKRWQVAEARTAEPQARSTMASFPPADQWEIVPTPREYRFLADPFYSPGDNGFLVEALRKSTNVGEILHMAPGGNRPLLSSRRHWSYPATQTFEGRHFVTPETGTWSAPKIFQFDDGSLTQVGELDVPGYPRLIDPTLFQHSGALYLFANAVDETPGVLRLWVSDTLFGRFTEHPCSPIRISPVGSRMGGAIICDDSGLYRVGQDYAEQYGDGVILFAITTLSRELYQEAECARLRFTTVKGPHTLNFREDRVLFDFYRESVTLLAGWQRLRALSRNG